MPMTRCPRACGERKDVHCAAGRAREVDMSEEEVFRVFGGEGGGEVACGGEGGGDDIEASSGD